MDVVGDKAQFMHRTFAEYFTARWFSNNLESNRSVLAHILFDRKHSLVRVTFDRMVATFWDVTLSRFVNIYATLREDCGLSFWVLESKRSNCLDSEDGDSKILWNARNYLLK
jgi:hypothetical protein